MDEFIKSVRAALYDRAVSPLSGTFIIAWIGWNYQFFMILMANLDLDQKWILIDKHFYSIALPFLPALPANGFVYPLVTAAAYIVIYPLLALPSFGYVVLYQRLLRQVKQTIARERVLTREESRALNAAIEDHEARSIEQEEGHRRLVDDLKAQNDGMKTRNAELEDSVKQLSGERDSLMAKNDLYDPDEIDRLSATNEEQQSKVEELKRDIAVLRNNVAEKDIQIVALEADKGAYRELVKVLPTPNTEVSDADSSPRYGSLWTEGLDHLETKERSVALGLSTRAIHVLYFMRNTDGRHVLGLRNFEGLEDKFGRFHGPVSRALSELEKVLALTKSIDRGYELTDFGSRLANYLNMVNLDRAFITE